MVGAKLYGGLGNRMFQQAAAIGYAKTHNVLFDVNKLNPLLPTDILKEVHHRYYHLTPPRNNRNQLLDGYWQSEKYFDHADDEVKEYFGAPIIFAEGICSIHVRRGDYLLYPDKHPVVTIDYLEQAISYMHDNAGIRNFHVYSDGIDWCKQNMDIFEMHTIHFEYMTVSSDPKIDMISMSKCEHHIISNSTFSWFGAWMGANPNKIVVSPSASNWFGPGNYSLCTEDIIPDKWIQIKY